MRRMWMLLLVVALMVIALAVPAMAAEADHEHGTCNYAGGLCTECSKCDHENDPNWIDLSTKGSGATLPAGNYYVPEGGLTGTYYVKDAKVVICLNGSTWTGKGNTRPLTVQSGAEVLVVDCSTPDEGSYVSKGVIRGVNIIPAHTTGATTDKDGASATYISISSNAQYFGGTIKVTAGGVCKFYNGTITGGAAFKGGNVCVEGSAQSLAAFYLNGGQIVGLDREKTMNAAVAKYTVNNKEDNKGTQENFAIGILENATLIADGGIAVQNGGNVFVTHYATFYMGNALTAQIGDGNQVPKISNGVALWKQGGSVSCVGSAPSNEPKYASIEIASGTLSGGSSMDAGGSLHLGWGSLTMSGGLVEDGRKFTISSNKISGFGNPNASQQTVFANGLKLDMSGGYVNGGFNVTQHQVANNAPKLLADLEISGNAKIRVFYLTFGNGTNKYYMIPRIRFSNPGNDMLVKISTTSAYFTDTKYKYSEQNAAGDGKTNLSTIVFARPENITDAQWLAYQNDLLTSGKVVMSDSTAQLTFEENGILLRPNSERWRCVCGGGKNFLVDGQSVHIGQCDGYDHKWTAKDMATAGTALPTAAGYYYLVDKCNSTTDGLVYSNSQSAMEVNGSVYIDLNGLTIEASRRLVALSASNANNTSVTFTDTVGGGGFKFYTTFRGVGYSLSEDLNGEVASDEHSFLWVRENGTGTKEMNFYRLTIDGSNLRLANGVVGVARGTARFYNATIKGAETVKVKAVVWNAGANAYVEEYNADGTRKILGGHGGAIIVEGAGNLVMDNCQVIGKSSETSGAILYVNNNSGNIQISNTTITGGTAGNHGGEAFISNSADGSVSFVKCTINGGTCGLRGGIIYKAGAGSLSITDCQFTGGTANEYGGAIAKTNDGDLEVVRSTFTGAEGKLNGGTLYIGGANCSLVNCVLDGGQTDKAGGNIYINDSGVLNINGGQIKNGYAAVGGGNIQSGYKLTMTDVEMFDGITEANGGNLNVWAGLTTLNNCNIYGGEGSSDGCNININYYSSYNKTENITTINGGSIAGGIRHAYSNPTLILKGDVKIGALGAGSKSGVSLANGVKVDASALGENASVVFYVHNASTGRVIADDIGAATDFRLVNEGYYLATQTAEGKTALLLTNTVGENKLAVTGRLYSAWTGNMIDGDFVKLFSDFTNGTYNIPASVTLDLNGHALEKLTVASGKSIKMFNTSAIDYVAGSGYVILAEKQTNPFVRDFTTKGLISRNLRFVTIQEEDGKFTAHRIYLAVRSTVLYPKVTVETGERTALGYRIALRCDPVLAGYINGYGLKVGTSEDNIQTVNLVTETQKVSGEGKNNDNSKVIGMGFDYDTDLANTTFMGSAYIAFNDTFGVDPSIASSSVETSLKAMVESAFAKYNSLSTTQQSNLDWMKSEENYGGIMTDWDVTPPVSKAGYEALNNKKILFIGNSYTYWGRCVMAPEGLTLSQRNNDQGLFYQLCKANGINVEVTNWTYGGHNITDTMGVLKDDGTIEGCTQCNGKVHLDDLEDRYYDYVSIQLFYESAFSKYDGTLLEYLSHTINTFRDANPNVKFLFLVPRDAYSHRMDPHYKWVNEIDTLKAEGFLICNWGDMIYDVEIGDTAVPGATLNYSQSSFVISQSAADGHHQNMLVGYLTALMAYSAITGDSAEGQPYYFCDDPTINSVFDLEAYKAKYYKHTPTDADEKYEKLWPNGYEETNFVEIMRSEADMAGLQSLVDDYLAQYN